jgi:virginiamycin A acetyltransferase
MFKKQPRSYFDFNKFGDSMLFVEYERNTSTGNSRRLSNCESFILSPMSEVRDTEIEGSYELGTYSSVNRSVLMKGGGISSQSYVSDTILGPYTLVGARVSIGGFEHPKNWLSIHCFQWGQSTSHWKISIEAQRRLEVNSKPTPRQTIIGPDCWIGNNSVVLSSVEIGTGAIIGAGSVVTKNVPPYSISVGNPAKVIGTRFNEDIISELLELKWWELDIEEVSQLAYTDIDSSLATLRKIRNQLNKKHTN